jgi:DNA-binding CsgD family transcriptional regulator
MYDGPERRLSKRQRQVLIGLANSKTLKQIACDLGLSIKTVETHKAKLRRKLKIESTAGLVKYAIRRKLVEP